MGFDASYTPPSAPGIAQDKSTQGAAGKSSGDLRNAVLTALFGTPVGGKWPGAKGAGGAGTCPACGQSMSGGNTDDPGDN
jgi:hypothetical protein